MVLCIAPYIAPDKFSNERKSGNKGIYSFQNISLIMYILNNIGSETTERRLGTLRLQRQEQQEQR